VRARTAVKALAWLALAVVVVLAAGFAWLKLAPRHVPEGQTALATLDVESLPAFRSAFNSAAGQVRIVALLSPT
jgi:hypothetical protein